MLSLIKLHPSALKNDRDVISRSFEGLWSRLFLRSGSSSLFELRTTDPSLLASLNRKERDSAIMPQPHRNDAWMQAHCLYAPERLQQIVTSHTPQLVSELLQADLCISQQHIGVIIVKDWILQGCVTHSQASFHHNTLFGLPDSDNRHSSNG